MGGADPEVPGKAVSAAGKPHMRADARRNYERLLAAAAAAFTERGADDVSLEEIARRAGVGIGTLYRHFPARQDLLEAVYRDQVEGLDALGAKLEAAEAPGAALTDWLRAFMAFGATKRSLSSALVATAGKDSALVSGCSQLLRDRTEDLLGRAQAAGEARPDVQPADLLRLAHSLILAGDTATDPGQPTRLLDLVLDSVVPPGGARPQQ